MKSSEEQEKEIHKQACETADLELDEDGFCDTQGKDADESEEIGDKYLDEEFEIIIF